MPGMKTECNRLPIRGPQPALRADDEEFIAPQLTRVPAHPCILGQSKEVTTGPVQQHFSGQWQLPGRTSSFGFNQVDAITAAREDLCRNAHVARIVSQERRLCTRELMIAVRQTARHAHGFEVNTPN